MQEEGYIKFNCTWKRKAIIIQDNYFKSLNYWREKLFALSLIGMYKNGIGFGNLSCREKDNVFLITGSATGGKKQLERSDYARVSSVNIGKNSLVCEGKTKASSESLSHAAIYNCLPEVESVIHVHSHKMWKHFFNKLPTTSKLMRYLLPLSGIG